MKLLGYLTYVVFIIIALQGAGCSSSDDGGTSASGDTTTPGDTSTPTYRAITVDNAGQTISEAVSIGSTFLEAAGAVDATQTHTVMDVINFVRTIIRGQAGGTTLSMALGIVETFPCLNPEGSYTNTYEENSTSRTGSVAFINCDAGAANIDGVIYYSASLNGDDYTENMSGNATLEYDGIVVTVNVTDFNETGKLSTSDYSINVFTYEISNTVGDGFVVELLAPIAGIYRNCPDSGIVLVSGANDTQAKGTVVNSDVTVEHNDGDGVFAFVESGVCTNYFN